MAATIPMPRPDDPGGSPHPLPRSPRPAQCWRRSRFSQGADATCVEVAVEERSVSVRDSKDPTGPVLRFSVAEWRVFLLGVRAGEFEPHDPSGPHRSSASRAASSSRERSGSAATRPAAASASE